MPVIATAAWSIASTVADRFPANGSGLSRYAAVFRGVEVNTTFYRRHRRDTFARWAASVPDDFRFALKIPQEITHDMRLAGIGERFASFVDEIAPLKRKIGPLLCQLPPSLPFDPDIAQEAFTVMRRLHAGPLAIEPRHRTWAGAAAKALFSRFSIDRVLADPPVVWDAAQFSGPVRYLRLHGRPKLYHSPYSAAEVDGFLDRLADDGWCVFDNTASGAATVNALEALERHSVAGDLLSENRAEP